jgi:hypothetical protein
MVEGHRHVVQNFEAQGPGQVALLVFDGLEEIPVRGEFKDHREGRVMRNSIACAYVDLVGGKREGGGRGLAKKTYVGSTFRLYSRCRLVKIRCALQQGSAPLYGWVGVRWRAASFGLLQPPQPPSASFSLLQPPSAFFVLLQLPPIFFYTRSFLFNITDAYFFYGHITCLIFTNMYR